MPNSDLCTFNFPQKCAIVLNSSFFFLNGTIVRLYIGGGRLHIRVAKPKPLGSFIFGAFYLKFWYRSFFCFQKCDVLDGNWGFSALLDFILWVCQGHIIWAAEFLDGGYFLGFFKLGGFTARTITITQQAKSWRTLRVQKEWSVASPS